MDIRIFPELAPLASASIAIPCEAFTSLFIFIVPVLFINPPKASLLFTASIPTDFSIYEPGVASLSFISIKALFSATAPFVPLLSTAIIPKFSDPVTLISADPILL